MALQNSSLTQVLFQYGVSQEGVFQDLSEEGKVLWHNDRLAIKVVKPYGSEAKLSLVSLHPERGYMYFECPLSDVDHADLSPLIARVENDSMLIMNDLAGCPVHVVILEANGKSIRLERVAA